MKPYSVRIMTKSGRTTSTVIFADNAISALELAETLYTASRVMTKPVETNVGNS
jgi:hypothetical protein